jgi:hypothetical protein
MRMSFKTAPLGAQIPCKLLMLANRPEVRNIGVADDGV